MSPTIVIDAVANTVPRHVAIIMDGNRRWAKARNLPTMEGHRRGILALREITRAASDAGVQIVTVYGFSTENWRRDANEIAFLFDLCVHFAKNELAELNKNNVQVRIIGDWQAFPEKSRNALAELQRNTETNTGLVLNLAVNYSSRAEIERAVRQIAADVKDGKLEVDAIDETVIASKMFTAGIPDPDLLIRPGGEHRLSNFLLYQAAYTELVLSDVFWPDFSAKHFHDALADFAQRQRRFGGS